MQLVALVGTLAFVIMGSFVGARLLLRAYHTGGRPELCMGTALFAYAALGQPLAVAGRFVGARFGEEARLVVTALALVFVVSSVAGLFAFNWIVFRPRSRAGAAAVFAAAAAAALASLVIVATLPPAGAPYGRALKLALATLSVCFGSGMLWASVEALVYGMQMRRRLALGLADPVVVNRFLLWGVGSGATGAISFAIIGCVAAGMEVAAHPVPLLATALSGTISSATWYLTFLPPDRYLRWVARSAERRARSEA